MANTEIDGLIDGDEERGHRWGLGPTGLLPFLGASIFSVLAGCAAQGTWDHADASDPFQAADSASKELGRVEATPASSEGADPYEEPSAPVIFRGSDQTAKLPAPQPPVRLDGDAVMLNFEQAPLADVMHSILGEILGLDYVIDRPVKGEITIRTRSPIPRDQLLPILESLLQNNNVVMVRGPNDRYFVTGPDKINSTLPRYQSAPGGGYSNIIIPLQYIGANEMAEILKPVAREDTFVRVDNRRNLLVLAGTSLQLEGWLDIISIFDVDQLAGMSVGIFPLANASVEAISLELEHLIGGTSQGSSGLGEVVRVMPIERLNSILVVSPRQHYIDQVGQWIAQLDGAGDPSSEATLYVYEVRNGNAAQLASLLRVIYGGTSGSGGGSDSVAPGMTKVTSASGSGSSASQNSRGPSGSSSSAGAIMLGDDVRVVSDDFNNSLLVYAPAQEYRRIETILNKLDVIATQVLIEASIVEVTLIDDLEYGLEWAFSGGLGGGDMGSGLLALSPGPLGPRAPGFSYTVTNSAGAVKAVLNALAEKSLINVISTPSIMVLDNHTASIHVGDQQPIQSSSVVTNGGNVQNSISYKDTGVKLQVTPSVNDGGLVTMDIDQSVTDVGVVDPATGQRSFLERNVASRVAVRSGQSVVLGGLIRDNTASGKSGIPLLMDIPLLGALFSTQTETETRTELLIFITPTVLEEEEDLRALNQEMRSRMRGLTNFSDLPSSVTGGEQE